MKKLYTRLDTALCNVTELKYRLSRRLSRNNKDLFPNKHMKYDKTAFETNDGPDLTEMVAAIDECQALLDQARSLSLPARIQARLAEDAGPLAYASNILHFFDVIVRATQLLHADKQAEAVKLLPEIKRLGKALESDTVNMANSSSHASAANGLVASYIVPAYQRLLGQLSPMDPASIKDFDPSKPLVIHGQDFYGGGRLKYGRGFQLNPGKADTKLCKKGNFIYAKNNGIYNHVVASVRLTSVPAGGLQLTLVGMSCPEVGKKDVPIRITMNDKEVFAGEGGFPEQKLTPQQCTIPAAVLKAGVNKLRIQNAVPKGPTGNRPWFGIERVELRVP
jgi:hypothetical protein